MYKNNVIIFFFFFCQILSLTRKYDTLKCLSWKKRFYYGNIYGVVRAYRRYKIYTRYSNLAIINN